MNYMKPVIADYGTLLELTAAGALGNAEDGGDKAVNIDASPVAKVSLNLFP